MALTWDQLGNLGLTAGQKTKLAAAETLGKALSSRGKGGATPDFNSVTPAQAKAILSFVADVEALMSSARRGAAAVMNKVRQDAATTADGAVPSGSL